VSDPSKEGWDERMAMRDATLSVLIKVDSSDMTKVEDPQNAWHQSGLPDILSSSFVKIMSVHRDGYSAPSKRPNISHGVTGYYFKKKVCFEILHFDNTPKCEVVQHLLGCMVLVGSQKKDNYRDGVVGLCINSMANLVWKDNTSYSTSKACSLKQTPNAPGIAFLFERSFFVRTRCKQFRATDPRSNSFFSAGFSELTDTRLGKEEYAAADRMILIRRTW
jgi:hypothetical protein